MGVRSSSGNTQMAKLVGAKLQWLSYFIRTKYVLFALLATYAFSMYTVFVQQRSVLQQQMTPDFGFVPAKDPATLSNLSQRRNAKRGRDKKTVSQPKPEPWSWPHVHIVQSRFMQDQSRFKNLARARLELFRIFCLPTMKAQTTQQFLWIIRTDPELDKSILNEFIDLLKDHPNFYLVGDNEQGRPFDEIDVEKIYTGNRTLYLNAKSEHEQKSLPLFETRLDADDGLHVDYLRDIQNRATESFARKKKLKWLVFCAQAATEWRMYPNGTYGSISNIEKTTIENKIWKPMCISPGLTVATPAGVFDRVDNPGYLEHSNVVKAINIMIEQKIESCGYKEVSKCLVILTSNNGSFPVVRSRTPTSTGMSDVFVSDERMLNEVDQTMDRLKVLQVDYNISRDDLQGLNKYMEEHVFDIAKENLKGMCTKGHSCKPTTKKRLQTLLNKGYPSNSNSASSTMKIARRVEAEPSSATQARTEKTVSQPELKPWSWPHVHIVQSRFMQDQSKLTNLARARLELFRIFSLPTMKAQTTQQFLWIIRTDPKLDKSIRNEMIDMLKDHPNFYLVGNNGQGRPFDEIPTTKKYLNRIYTGNRTLFKIARSKHEQKSLPLFETRLDADDGLHVDYLRDIQNRATQSFARDKLNWLVFCAQAATEWRMYPNGAYGSISNIKKTTTSNIQKTMCISPGLTVATPAGVSRRKNPGFLEHDKVELTINDLSEQESCGYNEASKCLVILKSSNGSFPVIRARTPTSQGMRLVFGSDEEMLKEADKTMDRLKVLQVDYNISRDGLQGLNKYMEEHLNDIAKDNLEGQCTRGHSCKPASRDYLKSLIDKS